MLVVRGDYEVVAKTSEQSRLRLLRLLHVILMAAGQRGYGVRLQAPRDERRRERGHRALQVVIDEDAAISISAHEHLIRKVREKNDREKRWSFLDREYDLVPSGRFVLALRIPWATDTRTRWQDDGKGRLEDRIGEIVWAIGEAANSLIVHRARVAEEARHAEIRQMAAEERAREERQCAEEERRRQERAAQIATHEQGLREDLVRMAGAWRQADTVRAFLDAVEVAVPAADRAEGFRVWLRWATEYAGQLDPLNMPQKIAKALEPDLASG